MDLRDIYKTSHPKPAEYKLFSSVQETFSRKYYMLGTKEVLVNLRKLKPYQTFGGGDHNIMKLEINCKKKIGKHKHVEAIQWVNEKKNQRGNLI